MFGILGKRLVYIVMVLTVLVVGLSGCSGLNLSAVPLEGNTPDGATDVLTMGQDVYEAQCAECHGPGGEGQPNWRQANADGVFPAPPHDSTGHTWHHPDPQLLDIIAQGGSMPNSQMPAYADVLSRAEMEAVLAYIKTFWGEREREYQEQVTKQFEAQ